MNLVDGQILETGACEVVLQTLHSRILSTLSQPPLSPQQVIEACDRLVSQFDETFYLHAMDALGIPETLGKNYVAEARTMFCKEALHRRMVREFGEGYDRPAVYSPQDGLMVTEQIHPLGVLLHIAAGNADGLPAFSVLEGLLTGNINILKLPAAEGGLSIRLLQALIQAEPLLAPYIYVFDYSSKDIDHINRLIEAADGVVVWGGVEAVKAFRTLLPPHVRLIEWGHKLSFAYVTPDGITDEALYGVAVNVASTGQLLCSSCQGIYVDTEDMAVVYRFCERFLPLLDSAAAEYTHEMDMGIRAQAALQRYTAELETIYTGSRLFKGRHSCLVACTDETLEPAPGVHTIWVKPLPKKRLLAALRPYKNYLQTAALVCGEQEKAELTSLLLKTGLVRLCPGERMSTVYPGAPHDGEYPLRRYTKVVSVE